MKVIVNCFKEGCNLCRSLPISLSLSAPCLKVVVLSKGKILWQITNCDFLKGNNIYWFFNAYYLLGPILDMLFS